MRRIAAVLGMCVLLAACSSSGSPAADLQTKLNGVNDAANAKDAAGLRTAVGRFLQEVDSQSRNGDITATKAQDLRNVAARVQADASLLEETASPTPAPSSAAPSPSPSPSPTPEPSPSPSPPPSPSPERSESSPSPDLVPSIGVSSSPAASPSS